MSFAKMLDSCTARLQDLSYDQYQSALWGVANHFLEGHLADLCEIVEAQRRIAEATAFAAVLKERSFDECVGVLAKLRSLGFSTIGQEFTIVSLMARHFVTSNKRDEGIELCQDLLSKLDSVVAESSHLRQALANWLSDLKGTG